MKKNSDNVKLRSYFFMSSMLLFFILCAILSYSTKINILGGYVIKGEVISTVCVILALFSFIVSYIIIDKTKSAGNAAVKIKKIASKNFEHLVFMMTYIVPLVFLDFTDIRNIIAITIILIFMFKISINTSLYLSNPTLAIFGYKLYEIETEKDDNIVLAITKDECAIGDSIQWIQLERNVWYIRKKGLSETNS